VRRCCSVILLSAGQGERLKAGQPKGLVALGGKSLLERSLDIFTGFESLEQLVVVMPRGHEDALGRARPSVILTTGAATRGASVRNGLRCLKPETEWIMIHDAARPLASQRLLDRVWEAMNFEGGVVPVLPVADTIKTVDDQGQVVGTLDRQQLRRIQTPQGFHGPTLRRAYHQAEQKGWEATDDAGLLERAGFPIRTVDGEEMNFKITTPHDFALAQACLVCAEFFTPCA
jgi:2-C-methyl-D-erythritol 4-phosphate cytidylyltransferase